MSQTSLAAMPSALAARAIRLSSVTSTAPSLGGDGEVQRIRSAEIEGVPVGEAGSAAEMGTLDGQEHERIPRS